MAAAAVLFVSCPIFAIFSVAKTKFWKDSPVVTLKGLYIATTERTFPLFLWIK